MSAKKVVFYLPEGFADWEGAFLMSELVEANRDFVTVTESGTSVRSIGRLHVTPDAALSSVSLDNMEMLVLIGSDGWQNPNLNCKALDVAALLLERGTWVAGICGGTTGLARAGLLEQRKHTSNDLGMLKKIVPTYRGEKNYVQKVAVADQNLITATGIAPIEFTFEALKALNIYSDKKRDQWLAMYKTGVMPPMDFWR